MIVAGHIPVAPPPPAPRFGDLDHQTSAHRKWDRHRPGVAGRHRDAPQQCSDEPVATTAAAVRDNAPERLARDGAVPPCGTAARAPDTWASSRNEAAGAR